MESVKILLTCIGGRFSRNTIKLLKENREPKITVIGADSDTNAASREDVDRFYLLPHGSDSEYATKLLEICRTEKIDIVIPCADEEVKAISIYKYQFDRESVACAVDSHKTVELTNDKFALFEYLSKNGIEMPRYKLISNAEELRESTVYFRYPKEKFVLKPRYGRGARGIYIIGSDGGSKSLEDVLDTFSNLPMNSIAMECLPGEAYDVDVLARDGSPLCIVPRRRTWTNKLSPFNEGCEVENNKTLIEFVAKITALLKLNYVYDFDCGITAKGKPALYEINPRFSGAIAASAGAGANIPVMLVRMMHGLDIPEMRIKFGTKMIPKPNGDMEFIYYKESSYANKS